MIERHVTNDLFEEQLEKVSCSIQDPIQGLFGQNSMMWRLARHALIGAHGSGRALLLQISHPWVTLGIDEHSSTRNDPLGRAVRTYTAVVSIVYGSKDQAMRQARIVRAAHDKVNGIITKNLGAFEKGSSYNANEANAMLWVHATLWDTSVAIHELFYGPLSATEKACFYEETKLFAYMFGIPESIVPKTWDDFMDYNRAMWSSDYLLVNDDTLDLARFVFTPLHPILSPAMAWLKQITSATLPERFRDEFGFSTPNPLILNLGTRVIRNTEYFLPKVIKYGPSYVEATRRIEGKSSTVVTRMLTKNLFGKPELVSLER